MPSPGEGARRPRAAPQPSSPAAAGAGRPVQGPRGAGGCSPRGEPGAGEPREPRAASASLPCMFSGICPWSPCDRASPRASVSTLGSMTRRPRAGAGGPCPSGSPAPERGRHGFTSAGKKEGAAGRLLSRWRAGARPRRLRGCRQDPGAPSRLAAPQPPLNREKEAAGTERRLSPGAGARLGEGAAAGGAGARPAELRARSGGGGRAAAAAAAAAPGRLGSATRAPPSAVLRSGSAGSPARAVSGLRLLSSAPRPCVPPSRSLSGVQLEVPASLRRLVHSRPGAVLCSPGAARLGVGEREGSRTGSGEAGMRVRAGDGDAGSGLGSDPRRQPMRTRPRLPGPSPPQPLHPASPPPTPPGPGRGMRARRVLERLRGDLCLSAAAEEKLVGGVGAKGGSPRGCAHRAC